MIDIHSRYKAAFIYKLKEIAQATEKSEFRVKAAYYNIGFSLRKVNSSLFSNLEPHKTVGNLYWKKVGSILQELPEDLEWSTIKFKDIYLLFKSMVESKNESKPWVDIHYFGKRYKHFFTNHERQISYLVANNALLFGQTLRQTSVFIDVEKWFAYNCKFCNGYEDNLDHLLTPKCIAMKQVFLMVKHYFRFELNQDVIFDEALIFQNAVAGFDKMKTSSKNFKVALAKMKICAILKKVIIDEKMNCDKYGTFIAWDKRLDLINKLTSKVRTSFSFFISKL